MSSTLNYRLDIHRVERNSTSCSLQVDAEHFNKHRLAYICALTALATFLILHKYFNSVLQDVLATSIKYYQLTIQIYCSTLEYRNCTRCF